MLLSKNIPLQEMPLGDARNELLKMMKEAPAYILGKNLATDTSNIKYESHSVLSDFKKYIPEGAIVDSHVHEVGNTSVNRPTQKDIHRSDIQKLDESRAVVLLKENINKFLSNHSEAYQQVIESDLIPAMVEDLGMGVLSVTNIANLYSNWDEQNKLSNTIRVLEKMIQNKEPVDREKPMSLSMTVNVREYGKKVEKPDNTAVYEKLRSQLLKQKFILGFLPEVKKIIVEELLPEIISEDFTEMELFSLEKEEIKYHLYQALVELSKLNLIKAKQEKIEIAQHALQSRFVPKRIPFGQQ